MPVARPPSCATGPGVALSLKSSGQGFPSLRVSSSARVRRLNADLLDGRSASALATHAVSYLAGKRGDVVNGAGFWRVKSGARHLPGELHSVRGPGCGGARGVGRRHLRCCRPEHDRTQHDGVHRRLRHVHQRFPDPDVRRQHGPRHQRRLPRESSARPPPTRTSPCSSRSLPRSPTWTHAPSGRRSRRRPLRHGRAASSQSSTAESRWEGADGGHSTSEECVVRRDADQVADLADEPLVEGDEGVGRELGDRDVLSVLASMFRLAGLTVVVDAAAGWWRGVRAWLIAGAGVRRFSGSWSSGRVGGVRRCAAWSSRCR